MLKTVRSYYNYWFMTVSTLSSVRALIFDLDGTIIDSQRDLIRSVHAMLEEMGREQLHEDTISGYIGHGAPQLVARALGGRRHRGRMPARAEIFFSAITKTTRWIRRARTRSSGKRSSISAAFPMAILTNKPVRVSMRILEELGLAKYFRVVYGGNQL